MLFLAIKRTLPRGLMMSFAASAGVLGMTYFQTGSIHWINLAAILPIALLATFLLYVPVEYHNLKADRKRAELAKRIRTMS